MARPGEKKRNRSSSQYIAEAALAAGVALAAAARARARRARLAAAAHERILATRAWMVEGI